MDILGCIELIELNTLYIHLTKVYVPTMDKNGVMLALFHCDTRLTVCEVTPPITIRKY